MDDKLDLMEEETRLCEICGKPVHAGMTDDCGSFYVHEECFKEYMDRIFGEGKWRETEDDGEGGFYEAYYESLKGEKTWHGTSIYYTEWEE